MFFKKYANREELIRKLEYQTKDEDKRKNYSNINDFILDEIKIIKNYLKSKKIIVNDEFILSVRSKHCMNEFNDYLNTGEYEMCFYDLYEFIESDKKRLYDSPIQIESGYTYYKYITSKEINIINKMIEELEIKIKE